MDFFSILKSYNKHQSSTYGDLLTENKEDRLKRDLSDSELEDYTKIKDNNRQRIFESGGNNINTDYKLENPIQRNISGIGQVQQMM